MKGLSQFAVYSVLVAHRGQNVRRWRWVLYDRGNRIAARSRLYSSARTARLAIRDVAQVWLPEAVAQPFRGA